MKAARLALVERCKGLAWHLGNRWHRLNPQTDPEDWYRTAVGGMWEASLRFEPDRGYVFQTYAGWYVKKWFRGPAYHEAARGMHVPVSHEMTWVPVAVLGGVVGRDGETDFASTIAGRESDPRDAPPPAEFWEAVDRTVTNERERLVLRRRFRDGKQLQEVGDELGITRERVRQIEARALERLREQKGKFAGFMDD